MKKNEKQLEFQGLFCPKSTGSDPNTTIKYLGQAEAYAAVVQCARCPPAVFSYQAPEFQNTFSFNPKGWMEALPVGNGRVGAMVFGGVNRERIQLNEETLWDGNRYDSDNPAAAKALPEVQRLMFAGDNDAAGGLPPTNVPPGTPDVIFFRKTNSTNMAPLITLLILMSTLSSLGLQALAPPQEVFVSPVGSDFNPGTRNKPFRSIQKAINQLEAGKSVTLLEGVYDLSEPITITAKGSADRWVIIRGEKGAKVILDGLKINIPGQSTYPHNNGLVQIEHAAYVRLVNLHVRNSRRSGINIQESRYVDVINCTSENSLSPGIASWQRCEYIRILGNTVINANDMKMSWTPYKGHEAPHEAISVAGSHHFEVAWNHVYNGQKEGIDVKETAAFGTVHHNYVHDCKRQGLYIDGWFGQLEHIEMYENVVHNCEAGIALSSEDGPNTKNLRIHHNLVYNNRATGIFFSRWGADNLREEVDIFNNTFYRNGWGKDFSGDPQYWLSGGCYLYSTKLKDVRIQNNIFARNFPFEIGHTDKLVDQWASLQRIDISRNLIQDINKVDYPMYLHTWLNDSVYSTTGSHAILADPLFENPEEGDFRLKENSPAKDITGNYLGAFPKGSTREGFWWKGNFPPAIDIENYQPTYPSGTRE